MIELTEVSRLYPTGGGLFRALDGVNLRVASGSFVAIVGRSGSGKSTLMSLIAGLDRPTSGRISVAGTLLDGLSESALAAWRGRTAGVVFQFFQLLPALTILENTMLPMDYCGTLPPAKARARALSLLERVGILDQADKLPSALSGGQQQRAAIARALANDPPLLVADEPTGNLDSITAGSVLDLLGSLVGEGKTVLMVTHDRSIADRVDRIITLVDGRVEVDEASSRGVRRA